MLDDEPDTLTLKWLICYGRKSIFLVWGQESSPQKSISSLIKLTVWTLQVRCLLSLFKFRSIRMKCCSGASCSGCAAMNILILQIPVLYFTSSLSATICSVVAFLVWTLQLGTLSVHASQQVLNPIFPKTYYVSRAGCEDCCHLGLNYISKGVKYIYMHPVRSGPLLSLLFLWG